MTGHPQIILEGLELEDTFHLLGECETFFTQQAVTMAARMFSQRSDEPPENVQSSQANQPKQSTQ